MDPLGNSSSCRVRCGELKHYVAFSQDTLIPVGRSAAGASGLRNTWRIASTIGPIREWNSGNADKLSVARLPLFRGSFRTSFILPKDHRGVNRLRSLG
jgi:hypothetical protein